MSHRRFYRSGTAALLGLWLTFGHNACVATRQNLHGEPLNRVERRFEVDHVARRILYFRTGEALHFACQLERSGRLREYRMYRVERDQVQADYDVRFDLLEIVAVPIMIAGLVLWPLYLPIYGLATVDQQEGQENQDPVEYGIYDSWILPIVAIVPGYQFLGPDTNLRGETPLQEPTDEVYGEPIPRPMALRRSERENAGACRAMRNGREVEAQSRPDGWQTIEYGAGQFEIVYLEDEEVVARSIVDSLADADE